MGDRNRKLPGQARCSARLRDTWQPWVGLSLRSGRAPQRQASAVPSLFRCLAPGFFGLHHGDTGQRESIDKLTHSLSLHKAIGEFSTCGDAGDEVHAVEQVTASQIFRAPGQEVDVRNDDVGQACSSNLDKILRFLLCGNH